MSTARNAKRALLVSSGGGDNHSRYNENDVKRLVREADTQLYAVGMFDPLGHRSRTPEELNGPSLLSELTELTGGRALKWRMRTNCRTSPRKPAQSCATNILGYRSSNKSYDARWRKIKVKLRAPKGLPPLSIYAKTGYAQPLDSPISKCLEAGGYRVSIELFRATSR